MAGFDVALDLGQLAVFDLGGFLPVAGARGALFFGARLLQFFLELLHARDGALLAGPALFEAGRFAAQPLEFVLDVAQAVLRRRVLFPVQRLALDFEMRDAALDVVDFDRHAADLNLQRGAGFVDQVDGLVGQEAVGDVAMREHGGRDDGGVLDAHAVVDLELFLEAAQNGDGVVDRRLAHQHGLEAARQGGVLFDVLAVFGQRGGADAAQFAARESRLQHVGRVDRAFGATRADQRVQLVDEADDFAVRFGDFLENGLQAVFEFAAELGARDHLSRGRSRPASCCAADRARRP